MIRYIPFALIITASVICSVFVFASAFFAWALIVLLPLVALGVRDLLQQKHSIQRIYPVIGHLRWLIEEVRPQVHQYIVEGELEGRPFSRDMRSIAYRRAKDSLDVKPFGTELDVYSDQYEWINHSIRTKPVAKEPFRVDIGGPQCARPYSASLLNISAMSFGALGGRAISALNLGAKLGGFAHDTGEGGISRYHRLHGGDLIWEIGSGYFGCRNPDGTFNPDKFRQNAQLDEVKVIEIKLSQGAKPGHGGVLPGKKVTKEIAEARDVPVGKTVISPASHSTFSTPIEFMAFIATLRELSDGKPVGFKLCVGYRWEFLAIVKAMIETGIYPDFIVVDGKEGGTGAAPLEFTNRIGMPLRDGLLFVHNALVGVGLRDRIRIGASGKIITAYHMAAALALGADWCNSARGFMFALGCLQSQKCHTGMCPTGITTQDPLRQNGLVVADKAHRVHNFHRHTMAAFAEVIAAAGLDHPQELQSRHICRRLGPNDWKTADHIYHFLKANELIETPDQSIYATDWAMAQAQSFHPAGALAMGST
jgi:glutamate synthase domain-containing protein 2